MAQDQLNNLSVLGAGVLGGQIAWQSAFKGKSVIVYDLYEAGLEQCRSAQQQYADIYRQSLGASEDMIDEAPIDPAPWPPEDGPVPEFEEPEQAGVGSTDGNSSPRDLVNQYREILADDPEGALADLGIAAVSPGSAEGYRLDTLSAESPYLRQTGLQPGDVILSVNGQPVGDVQRDQQQIDNVLSQGSARLEVQRGSRRFFVTASLNQ